MNDDSLLIKTAGSCRTLTLNRPEKKNAFDFTLAEALAEQLELAAGDESLRLVVLRGAGGAFSAGGDLKLFHERLDRADEAFRRISSLLNRAVLAIATSPKPVVAAVTGPAFAAGFGVALSCDILVASDTARLSPSFTNIGLAPNAGSTFFLPRVVGEKRAMEAFFTGRVWSASEAERLGLVHQVWPEANFETELENFCQKLLNRPTQSLGRIKNLLLASCGAELAAHLEMEKENIALSARSEDFRGGVRAFVRKHPAKFAGK